MYLCRLAHGSHGAADGRVDADRRGAHVTGALVAAGEVLAGAGATVPDRARTERRTSRSPPPRGSGPDGGQMAATFPGAPPGRAGGQTPARRPTEDHRRAG